jgi:hypothetical protein
VLAYVFGPLAIVCAEGLILLVALIRRHFI